MDAEHITDRCLVCGAAEGPFVPHLGDLLRCRDCGFVTARLDAAPDARALYDDDYFRTGEYHDYVAEEAFLKRNFRRRLRHILRYAPAGRLLEVGSAYGFFLDAARGNFDVVGFEVNQTAARYAREHYGVDARAGEVLGVDAAAIGGPVDVAVMWDVVEHLARPDLAVAKLASLSKPGALLVLTTGDIGSVVARLRGRKWRLIHPPTHLHYFSRPTIARLLARSGYRVVDIRALGVARSLHQVSHWVLARRLGRQGLHRALQRTIPAAWGFTLNTFDIMQVTATLDAAPEA